MSVGVGSFGLSPNIFTPIKRACYKQCELCVTIDDKVSLSICNKSTMQYGVVRFIGYIDGKPDSSYYYGIELDEANGKNDGKYNKIEYFRCGLKKGIFTSRIKINYVEYPNPLAPRISIGDTVKIGGKYKCKGIVKYIGIPSFKRLQGGNWYGIELNKKIGKTNGIINGIKYFESKQDYGVFVTSKLISVLSKNNKNNNNINTDDEKLNDNEQSHGITVHNIDSGSLGLLTTKKSARSRLKKIKNAKSMDLKSMNLTSMDLTSMNIIKEDKEEDKMDDNKNNNNNNNNTMQQKQYEKQYIIHDYGYPVTFLLSDKKPNISILKEQIINTFGHIEILDNYQIYIKNVDKMCLLVRINFHELKSFEKAANWRFWWKKKSVSMKKHALKKWREYIEVKEIFPINFEYKQSLNVSEDDVKKFLISYCNNIEELLQNKSQIQFINDNDNEYIKCVINFANRKAREKLFDSQYIQLININNNNNNDSNNNIDEYQCKLNIDIDSIKK